METTGPLGVFGYVKGPDVYVIDSNGLADPLISRLPIQDPTHWRIGHFKHIVPEGYMETLPSGENKIADPNLARYYDEVRLITRGALLDPERLATVRTDLTWGITILYSRHMSKQLNDRKLKDMPTHISTSQRLHENLGNLIASKKPGERLPSEPVLAQQLGVSRATLREAMRTFETQGLIRRRQGAGTFVTHPSTVIKSGLEILESIETMAERSGLQVAMGELQVERRMATEEEISQMDLPPQAFVTQISRVMHAEGRPVAYLIDLVPEDILLPT